MLPAAQDRAEENLDNLTQPAIGDRRPLRTPLLALAGAAMCAVVAYGCYRNAFDRHLATNIAADAARLEFHVASIESALAKYEALPKLLALEESLTGLLNHPSTQARVATANRYLEEVCAAANIGAAYLLNRRGITVAASNWRDPQSYVGHDYHVRPYFLDAVGGRPGIFYGVGITTGEPGLFLSAPVASVPHGLGAIVIKVSLAPIEAAWSQSGEWVAAADENSVIVLASDVSWKYHALTPLSTSALEGAAATKQYGNHALRPLFQTSAHAERSAIVELNGAPVLAQSRPAGPLGWKLLYFTNLRDVSQSATTEAVAWGFATAFVLSLAFYQWQRLQRMRERRELRAALERANTELEQRISERTRALTVTNADLQHTVIRLQDTERILRETQNQAVQAGRLAVLGQMAIGITHEISQPLTAMSTLTDNSVSLLGLGRLGDIHENLKMIGDLTQRMGRITSQLKTFARRDPVHLTSVPVLAALNNALMLVDPLRKQAKVDVQLEPFDPLACVSADSTRLEQVLVNLLRNSIEASEHSTAKRVEVRVAIHRTRIRITVRDHGPGLDDEVQAHLFEPFFTTKPPGKGLGLGLAISHVIIENLGGELTATNAAEGGAEFIVELNIP